MTIDRAELRRISEAQGADLVELDSATVLGLLDALEAERARGDAAEVGRDMWTQRALKEQARVAVLEGVVAKVRYECNNANDATDEWSGWISADPILSILDQAEAG